MHMRIKKINILCFLFFLIFLFFSLTLYGSGLVGGYIVTANDEYRYLIATDRLIYDIINNGLIYTIENYYNYTQSVHFMHYFILSFNRILFNDSMFFWVAYQLLMYCLGVYFFSRYMYLEYDFIDKKSILYISFLMFVYPVFYYLVFSLMRDISIFTLFSMCLFFYKNKNFKSLIFFLLILSFYRVNMTLCGLVYIFFDQLRFFNFFKIIKYIPFFVILVFIIDLVSFGLLFSALRRLNDFSVFDFLKEFLVLLFSPLPFSIDANLPDYLRLWFKISFFLSISTFVSGVFLMIIKNKIFPVLPVLAFSVFYVFIYTTESGVGFRQASIVLPFIYIPIFFFIISEINKKLT